MTTFSHSVFRSLFRGFAHETSSLFTTLVAPVLAVHTCASCDEPAAQNSAFCSSCANSVNRVHGEVAPNIWAFAEYGGPIRDAIHRLKFNDRPDLARPLGDLLARGLLPVVDQLRADVVLPIPVTTKRLHERMYNQAALLARQAARAWRLRVDCDVLTRVRSTGHQARLGENERADNVKGAMIASPTLRGHRVVLVDDVCTTGNTLREATRAIELQHGEVVACAVVAYTVREHP